MAKRIMTRCINISFFLLFTISCEEKDLSAANKSKSTWNKYVQMENEVGIQVLQKGPFQEEVLSNGKLVALQKSILKFSVGGVLQKLNVKNGDIVRKGDFLASLEDFKFQQAMKKARIDYERAVLDFEDMLVGRGYDSKNKDDIPNDIYKMLTIRSGLQEAKTRLSDMDFELKSTILNAPFKGKVAGLKYKVSDYVDSGTGFLTLIDDSVFEVEFHIMELEVSHIAIDDPVEVTIFESKNKHYGRITSINPMIEENGTILVKAKISNEGGLIDGANVKVSIKKSLLQKWVLPKTAIVLRQGREVLFKYKNGYAYWTYVQVTNENETNYSVIQDPEKKTSNLMDGDTIIVAGNFDLAHKSKVAIQN